MALPPVGTGTTRRDYTDYPPGPLRPFQFSGSAGAGFLAPGHSSLPWNPLSSVLPRPFLCRG